MANEPVITIIGNLTADPELRFTPSGAAVANFTVASTPRVKDGEQWVDGEAMFVRCAVWRDYGEHVAESLQKGHRVIVHGRLKVRSYQPRDGGPDRLSIEMDVEEVGHSLRFGTASFSREGGQPGRQQGRPQAGRGSGDPWNSQQGRQGRTVPQAGDPWDDTTPPPF